MKNKFLIILVLGLSIPVLVNASWWNPLSWSIFSLQEIQPKGQSYFLKHGQFSVFFPKEPTLATVQQDFGNGNTVTNYIYETGSPATPYNFEFIATYAKSALAGLKTPTEESLKNELSYTSRVGGFKVISSSIISYNGLSAIDYLMYNQDSGYYQLGKDVVKGDDLYMLSYFYLSGKKDKTKEGSFFKSLTFSTSTQDSLINASEKGGTVSNANPNKAELSQIAKTDNQVCKDFYGLNSIYSGQKNDEGNPICDCKDGYDWSKDGKFCQRTKQGVKVTPQTNQDSQVSVNTTAETLTRDKAIGMDDEIILGYSSLEESLISGLGKMREFVKNYPEQEAKTPFIASSCIPLISDQLNLLQKTKIATEKDRSYLQSQPPSFFLTYQPPKVTYVNLGELSKVRQLFLGPDSYMSNCTKSMNDRIFILQKTQSQTSLPQAKSGYQVCSENFQNETWDGTMVNGKYNCVCQAGYVWSGASCKLSFSQQQRQPEPRAVDNAVQINELKLQYQACRKNPIPLVFQNAQCDKIASQINDLGGRI